MTTTKSETTSNQTIVVVEINDKLHTIEEKSGRVSGRKDLKQLKGVREALARGEIDHHTLRSVAGEHVDPQCRDEIEALKRDFPDKFTHQLLSRAEAREAFQKGIQREPGKQMELPGVGEKAREQRDQQRSQEKEVRQQERVRADRERVQREAATRVAEEARARMERAVGSPQSARSAPESRSAPEPTGRDKVIRDAAEAVAKEARAARDKAMEPPAAPARTSGDDQARAAREAAGKERDAAIEWARGRMGPFQVPGTTSVPPPAPEARTADEVCRHRREADARAREARDRDGRARGK